MFDNHSRDRRRGCDGKPSGMPAVGSAHKTSIIDHVVVVHCVGLSTPFTLFVRNTATLWRGQRPSPRLSEARAAQFKQPSRPTAEPQPLEQHFASDAQDRRSLRGTRNPQCEPRICRRRPIQPTTLSRSPCSSCTTLMDNNLYSMLSYAKSNCIVIRRAACVGGNSGDLDVSGLLHTSRIWRGNGGVKMNRKLYRHSPCVEAR